MVYQYKLRRLAGSDSTYTNMGITIPPEFAEFFQVGTFFKVERAGASMIFTSGTSIIPTKKEVQVFDLESLKIS